VTDIVLDIAVSVQEIYEPYMKNYPFAESIVRKELNTNPAFKAFVEKCGEDLRIRRRDIMTFISRPVTRLPRFKLIIESIQKKLNDDTDRPEKETLQVAIDILSNFLKATQVGVDVATTRVKLYEICESLVFQKGEIINLDLYAESRNLTHTAEVARRNRTEVDWHGWNDLTLTLLDNYVILSTKEEHRGKTLQVVISRPIHVSFLRLGSFVGPPENRREEGLAGFLEKLRGEAAPFYPFVFSHAFHTSRRYTLFAPTDGLARDGRQRLMKLLHLGRLTAMSTSGLLEIYLKMDTSVLRQCWYQRTRLNLALVASLLPQVSSLMIGAT
jgi:hypothetical protein